MYISVTWVSSAKGINGVNAAVYLHGQSQLPTSCDDSEIANHTGIQFKEKRDFPKNQVHLIRAFIDIVLADNHYTPSNIEEALSDISRHITGDTDNPFNHTWSGHGAAIQMAYWINNSFPAPDSKRLILAMLKNTLVPWLKTDVPAVPPHTDDHHDQTTRFSAAS
jgi:hypothetical protein